MKNDGLSPVDRRALGSVATQFFVNGLLFASFIPRLPEIRDRIDIGNDTLGRLLAIGALSGVLGSFAVGRAVEFFGTRRLLIVAGVLLCASLSLVGIATVPLVLVLGLSLLSIFDVLVDTSMNMQGSWISGRRSTPVMNRLHGLWSLGTVIGGIGASQVANLGVSLRAHLFAVAAVMIVVVLVVGSGLLRVDESASEEPASVGGTVAGRVKRPVARRALAMFAVVGACSIAIEMTSSDWAAIRLSDDFAAAPGIAGLGFVAFTIGMTVGRFGGDSVAVRLGNRRMAGMAIGLTIIGLALASFGPNRWIAMLGYLLTGLGTSTQFPKLYDDAAKHRGRPGAGLAALTGGSRVAMLAMPVAVGALAASSLSVGAATAIVTLPAALAFAAFVRRSR